MAERFLALPSVFFLVLLVTISEPPRMMSSSANYKPFLSSFRHIPPQAADGKTLYLFKLGPKSFSDGRRTFVKIKHLIWDQLLATKAEIIQS